MDKLVVLLRVRFAGISLLFCCALSACSNEDASVDGNNGDSRDVSIEEIGDPDVDAGRQAVDDPSSENESAAPADADQPELKEPVLQEERVKGL